MACSVDLIARPIGLCSFSYRVVSERRRLPFGSVSYWSSAAMPRSVERPTVIRGTGPMSSVGGGPEATPTPCSGEWWLSVPISRLSQPTRWLDPGWASSTSSIAEKWDRLATVNPVAWIAARLPASHIGSSGASFGCRPNNESLARRRSFGMPIVGRAL